MSKVVEKPGHVERWEFHGGQDGRIYGGGDFVFSLEEDARDALALCAEYIDEDGLRELFHPSVVRAVQRRLGIVNKVTIGWILKRRDGKAYLDSTGRYVSRQSRARRFSRTEARKFAGDDYRVVRLWRRA